MREILSLVENLPEAFPHPAPGASSRMSQTGGKVIQMPRRSELSSPEEAVAFFDATGKPRLHPRAVT